MNDTVSHQSVLKEELIDGLDLKSGYTVIDGTLGLGGHAARVLEKIAPKGHLIGIDLDEKNLELARKRLKNYGSNVFYAHGRFDNLDKYLKEAGFDLCDAIYLDLGLSSPQIDSGERGFSFLKNGPLDMRFDQSIENEQKIAADLVNTLSEHELTRIFRDYGEESKAWLIAKAIVRQRQQGKIVTTNQLAELVSETVRAKIPGKHPATKIFQALRIAVNDELNVLKTALEKSIKILKPGGRLAVISYHSLEDRIVKQFFKILVKGCVCPPQLPICVCGQESSLKIITKKAIRPGEEEVGSNSRSRSARLRVGVKNNVIPVQTGI